MADPIVDVDDLALYLNDTVDGTRAQFILDLAHEKCQAYLSPLPLTARTVVLDVAQRAYTNPVSVRNADLGLYSEGQGPYSDGSPGVTSGGVWLTRGNIQDLRNLSTSGGAFSIDLTPTDAATSLPWWDTGVIWSGL